MILGRKSAAVTAWLAFILPVCAQSNGIFVGPVKVYDETAIEGLLNAAKANLASLNTFDQGTLNSHFGGVQGSTSTQTQISLQANGANVANPTAAPAAPTGFTLPSAFTPSAVDLLNEQMQAASQVINYQLLLKGSLNDQFEPDSNKARVRTTLGFPINISVPPGYKYQHAVAEIEVAVCTPHSDKRVPGPSLMTLLPQSKTYNVAALVSKSTGLGGGLVAGVVSAGGGFLHGRSTYYLVQAQDTLAMQEQFLPTCEAKELNAVNPEKKPQILHQDKKAKVTNGGETTQAAAGETTQAAAGETTQAAAGETAQAATGEENAEALNAKTQYLHFAWQFRPVLGQKIVQDGTRQTFAQVSLPWVANTMLGCSTKVLIRTSWKYYDNESGRVGGEIKGTGTLWEPRLPGVYSVPPVAAPSAEDNGDGTITVRAFGSFRDGVRVRIGGVIQDASTAGFEQNQQYVRFTASALSLANHGAELVYTDGNYWDLDETPPGATSFGNCQVPEPERKGSHVPLSWRPQAHAVSIIGTNTKFLTQRPRPQITANGKIIDSFTVVNNALIVADIDPLIKNLQITLDDKPVPIDQHVTDYKPEDTGVDVRSYNEASTLLTLKVGVPAPTTVGVVEVAVIGTKVYGLLDNPFYERTDSSISILVPNDVARSNRTVLWRQLFTPQTRIFHLVFAKPAGDLTTKPDVSDFQITGLQLLSNTGGGGSSAKTFALSDISMKSGAQTWTGSGVFAVSNGTPAIVSVTPSGAQPGETLAQPVTITGAFTHFTQGKPPDVVFGDSDIQVQTNSVSVIDDTHLHLNLKVAVGATPQTSSVTVTSGSEIAVGSSVFTVANAKALIIAVNPATTDANRMPVTGVTITGSGTHFMKARPTIGFSNSKVTAAVTSVESETQLTISLTAAADAPPGPTDIKVTTGTGDAAEVATGTALLTVAPSTPRIESVSPAAGQPGETLPVTIRLTSPLPGSVVSPVVTFSNLGVRLTNLKKSNDLTWTGTVNITSDALSNASAAPDTASKATNTYMITGSHLRGLKFLFPPTIVPGPVQRDTVMTFSLTDDQVKANKYVIVQNGDLEPVSYALPAPPSDSSTPAAPSLKPQALPIAINAPSVTVSGSGMKKVVDVQFQDKPLVFTSVSDTSLTAQTPPCPVTNNTNGCVWPPTGPAPSEIDLVFIYADQTRTRYAIAVQPPAPK